MNQIKRPLRIAIVAGEESGDLLGADLVRSLAQLSCRDTELAGVGGRHLQALGLDPLFDGSEIALMGIISVLKDLPRLLLRIGQTAKAVVDFQPDCLITIDSPDFSLRVAKKVRAANPSIPIVHYVCPSVWAWRQGRAKAMRPYVDRILCVLPFEPEFLTNLDGPRGTYVGHRLVQHPNVLAAAQAKTAKADDNQRVRNLLMLPGSRSSEVRKLIEPFGKTVEFLAQNDQTFRVLLPTVPHVTEIVKQATQDWVVIPDIITTEDEKWRAFAEADAALAASGTVALELALCGVPLISCYKTDPVFRPLLLKLIKVWSASLPNLIAGWPIVPEYYDAHIKPERLARTIEQLWADTTSRDAQMDGFKQVRSKMAIRRLPSELAAEAVLEEIS